MTGPIGTIETRTIEAVSKMRWWRDITFGQIIILIFMAGSFWGIREMVPVHLAQIQAGYERIDQRHSEQAKSAHDAANAELKTLREQSEKQWATVKEQADGYNVRLDHKDRIIRMLIEGKQGAFQPLPLPAPPCEDATTPGIE